MQQLYCNINGHLNFLATLGELDLV